MSGKDRAIATIGNANIDIVAGSIGDWPEWGTETFLSRSDFRIGGSAANTAIVLRRLGHRTGLISGCGDDEPGRMIARRFDGPLDRIATLPRRTSITMGILRDCGERSFFSTDGHLDDLGDAFFRDALGDWPLKGALALVSGAFALPALIANHTQLLHWLKDKGAEIAIDPGWPGQGWTPEAVELARQWFRVADHLLLNEAEALGVTGKQSMDDALDCLADMTRIGTRIVVKLGAAGAVCRSDDIHEHATGIPLEVVDTVGAGDAFNAGYLSALADGKPTRASLKRGNSVARQVISQFPREETPILKEEIDAAG